jgi:hypothetical protein
MENIFNVIKELQALDLSTYPYDKAKTTIHKFGVFGVISMTLHKGKVLIRARPNSERQTFSTRSELSYTPPKFNTRYQRASTPFQTMFYAGTIPIDIPANELNNARFIAALEASHLLRTVGHEGEQRITFSKWVVTDDIPLVAVCYHKDFMNKSSHTKELYDAFQQSMMTMDEQMRNKSVLITDYLASEFAKTDVDPDYKYMISAIFSEIVVSKKMAGVYFPSVRADAQGYNVAISPTYADRALRLVAAGECTIYKKGDHTIVDNETSCIIEDETKSFTFLPVDPQYHVGKENILKRLI